MANSSTSGQNISINGDFQSLNSDSHLQPSDSRGRNLAFFSQIIIISTVIIASIINLSIYNSTHTDLWIALLSACTGTVIPGPRLKKYKKRKNTHH